MHCHLNSCSQFITDLILIWNTWVLELVCRSQARCPGLRRRSLQSFQLSSGLAPLVMTAADEIWMRGDEAATVTLAWGTARRWNVIPALLVFKAAWHICTALFSLGCQVLNKYHLCGLWKSGQLQSPISRSSLISTSQNNQRVTLLHAQDQFGTTPCC